MDGISRMNVLSCTLQLSDLQSARFLANFCLQPKLCYSLLTKRKIPKRISKQGSTFC